MYIDSSFSQSEVYSQRSVEIDSSSKSSKKFWSLAKMVQNQFCRVSIPHLKDDSGTQLTEPLQKANKFAKFFANSSTNDDSGKVPPQPAASPITMLDPCFSECNVLKYIDQLDPSKSPGPDGIPVVLLKRCKLEIAPHLSRLFEASFARKAVPLNWKYAHVVPIPKKGDRSIVGNYRPIAITSVLSKLMESIINSRIVQHLECHKLISDRQYGFRPKRSTGDLLCYLQQIWLNSLNNFGECNVVALDIAKAFDKVWHKALLNKLPSYGISELVIAWISDFLSDRSISVRLDGVISDTYVTNSGVPQGCVLSPTLFLIFINDLLSVTANPINSFADDSTLHNSSSYLRNPNSSLLMDDRAVNKLSLEADLVKILDWGESNLVTFNSSKTQKVSISMKKTPHEALLMNSMPIEDTGSIHILGMTVTSRLDWRTHLLNVVKVASQRTSVLRRTRSYFTAENIAHLYKAQVRPVMEYCSFVWGGASPSQLALLDKIQRRVFSIIDDVSISSQFDSLSIRRDVAGLVVFYKYMHGLCSEEIQRIMPSIKKFRRSTRLSIAMHSMAVEIPTSRLTAHQQSFVPRLSRLWNSLPQHLFPVALNISLFKSSVYSYLKSVEPTNNQLGLPLV